MYTALITTLSIFLEEFPYFLVMYFTFHKYLKVKQQTFLFIFLTIFTIISFVSFFVIYYNDPSTYILLALQLIITTIYLLLIIIFFKIPFYKQLFSMGFLIIICLLVNYTAIYLGGLLGIDKNTIGGLSIHALLFLFLGIPLEVIYYNSFINTFDDILPKLYSIIWFFPFLIIVLFFIMINENKNDMLFYELSPLDFSIYFIVLLFGILFLYLLSKHIFSITIENLELSSRYTYRNFSKNNYFYIENKINEVNSMKYRGEEVLNDIKKLCELNKYNEINYYIDKILHDSTKFTEKIYTSNHIVNSILSDRLSLAENNSIKVGYEIDIPPTINIPNEDLCSLVMNILDNAINICRNSPKENIPYLLFSLHTKNNFLFISCENSSINSLNNSNIRYFYSKNDKYEYDVGIKVVKEIIDTYNGFTKIDFNSNKFIIKCYLSLKID